MLQALGQVRDSLSHDLQVLVVDDNSPDGTQGVVRDHMADAKHVRMITGNKQGLGAAYIRGMAKAMDMGASYLRNGL